MTTGELVTNIGCPGICPDGAKVKDLPSFKDGFARNSQIGVILESMTGHDESQMVPLEQDQDGKCLAHNGYADDMFPICEYALEDASTPSECPKKELVRQAIVDAIAVGGTLVERE